MADREDLDLYAGDPRFDQHSSEYREPPAVCPRPSCGHLDDDHDETGCALCPCPGPTLEAL